VSVRATSRMSAARRRALAVRPRHWY
jgi:hypothetical protein